MKVSSREIRISILYFIILLSIILGINLIKKSNWISWDGPVNYNKIGIVICTSIMIISVIPLFITSISHIVKAFKYGKVLNSEKIYIEWNYEKKQWREFIIKNFKMNFSKDIKGFFKAIVIVLIITTITLGIYSIINSTSMKFRTSYILIYMGAIAIMVSIYILSKVITLIDHLIFTNCRVTITEGMAILNEEVYKFNIKGESELESKKIKKGNLEITYAVPSDTARRVDNIRSLQFKKLKKIIIPIPKNEYESAERYIKAPYPIYNYMRDKKQ